MFFDMFLCLCCFYVLRSGLTAIRRKDENVVHFMHVQLLCFVAHARVKYL